MDLTVSNYNLKTPTFRAHFTQETAGMIQSGILAAVKLEKNPVEAEKLNKRLTKSLRQIESTLNKKFGAGEVSLLCKNADQGREMFISINGYEAKLPREIQQDKFAFVPDDEGFKIVKFPSGQLGNLKNFIEFLESRVGAKLSRSSERLIKRGIKVSSDINSSALNPEVIVGYKNAHERLNKILGAKSKVTISFDNELGANPKVTRILVQDSVAYKKYPLPDDLIPAFVTKEHKGFFVSNYKIKYILPEYLDKLCEYFENLKV